MMNDMREAVYGKARATLDDEHTAKTYQIYRERSKSINALFQILVILGIIAIFVATAVALAFVIWVWRILL